MKQNQLLLKHTHHSPHCLAKEDPDIRNSSDQCSQQTLHSYSKTTVKRSSMLVNSFTSGSTARNLRLSQSTSDSLSSRLFVEGVRFLLLSLQHCAFFSEAVSYFDFYFRPEESRQH